MRAFFLLAAATLAIVSVPASTGPYRCYSSCYSPSYSYSQPYYAPSYYQSYSYAPAYTAPAYPVAPTYEAKSWRTAVVEYAAGLKEIQAFNDAMNVITPGFAASHSTYYGGQAATLYGVQPAIAYGVKAVTATENVGVNLELADQRSARFNDGLRETLGQANGYRQDFLSQTSQENARVAEINAKAQAAALTIQQAAALLRDTGAANSSKTYTSIQATGTGGVAATQPTATATATASSLDPARTAFLEHVARPDCGRCHTAGPNMKGKFDINSVTSLTRAQADGVWKRLTSDDPTIVMPRPDAGKPVQHLPPDHLMQWAAMLSQAQ